MTRFKIVFFLFFFLAGAANAQVWQSKPFKCQWTTTLATLAEVQSNPIIAVADGAWTASSGTSTTITGATTLPLFTAGDYFEIRDHSTAGNNGLYRATGTPTTSSLTATKIQGTNPANAVAEAVSFYRSGQCDELTATTGTEHRFITDIVWTSSVVSSAAGHLFILSSGTGLDCATTSVVFFNDYSAPAFSGSNIHLLTPIKLPQNTEICVTHSVGGTINVNIAGFVQ